MSRTIPVLSFWSVGLKCPFPFDKIVPLFCILRARTITKQAVAWVGSGLFNRNVPFHWSPEFFLNRKHFDRGLAILLQTTNCGLPLMVSRYPSAHICDLRFAGSSSRLPCLFSFIHSELKLLQVYFTSAAIVVRLYNNSYTCKLHS